MDWIYWKAYALSMTIDLLWIVVPFIIVSLTMIGSRLPGRASSIERIRKDVRGPILDDVHAVNFLHKFLDDYRVSGVNPDTMCHNGQGVIMPFIHRLDEEEYAIYQIGRVKKGSVAFTMIENRRNVLLSSVTNVRGV